MKDTGGPAFPIPLQPDQIWQGMAPCDGMTLRDYFAAKASEEDIKAHIWKGYQEDYITSDGCGKKSIIQRQAMWTREEARYQYADAMLKARNQ